jgi:hypothetical protein
VGQAALALLIIGQPLAVLAVVLLPPLAMARRRPPRVPVALWALALGLLVVWGVATYRSSIADRSGGADSLPIGAVHWLGLALCVALASWLLLRRDPQG